MTEHEHQAALIKWARIKYPEKIIAAIPNGGKRHIGVAKKMKAEGQLAGMPDIIVAHANGIYHGLFVEMKSEKGSLSKSQKEIIAKLENEGYKVDVCYGWDDAREKIDSYINGEIA